MRNKKHNRKTIEVICDQCNKEYKKIESEYKRNQKLNRKSFCSRSCSAIFNNKYKSRKRSTENLKSNNRKDEYTLFRYTYRNINKRFQETDITLEDLKDLWESSNKKCPYSGANLVLPTYKNTISDTTIRASLDRIDSSKGYVKGNVEFISTAVNFMKNTMSKDETLNFCKLIANYHNSLVS